MRSLASSEAKGKVHGNMSGDALVPNRRIFTQLFPFTDNTIEGGSTHTWQKHSVKESPNRQFGVSDSNDTFAVGEDEKDLYESCAHRFSALRDVPHSRKWQGRDPLALRR